MGRHNTKNIDVMKHKKKVYGSYSLLLGLLLIGIIFVFNIIMNHLDLKLDLTEEQVFSLSKQTHQVLNELNEQVEITLLNEQSTETTAIKILNEYGRKNKMVEITQIDPELHPNLLKQYNETGKKLSYGSIIVSTGNKFKVIDAVDMYTYDSDATKIKEIQVESLVTSSILFVTGVDQSTIYTIQGHDEESLPNSLVTLLDNENYRLESLHLMRDEWIPKENDVLVMNSPKKDLTNEEADIIYKYLQDGGNLFLINDLLEEELPNLEELYNSLGVNISNEMIFEGDKDHTVASKNFYLLPNFSDHEIVKQLKDSNYSVMTVYAQPINILDLKKDTLNIEPLIYTSDKSYSKSIDEMKNNSSYEMGKNDSEGPFNIGVSIIEEQDKKDISLNSKTIIFSSSYLLEESFIEASNEANLDLVVNSINWLSERQDTISIRGKDVSSNVLHMNQKQQLVVGSIVIIVIPLLVILIGGVTLHIRKNR